MTNMGYCRFVNTYNDLSDCFDNWEDVEEGTNEEIWRERVLKLCEQIINWYGEE